MYETLKIRAKGSLLYILYWTACSLGTAAIWWFVSTLAIEGKPDYSGGVRQLLVMSLLMGTVFGTLMWTLGTVPSKAALEAPSIFPKELLEWRPLMWFVGVAGFTVTYLRVETFLDIVVSIVVSGFFFVMLWGLAAQRHAAGIAALRQSERKVFAEKLLEGFNAFELTTPQIVPEAHAWARDKIVDVVHDSLLTMAEPSLWWSQDRATVWREKIGTWVAAADELALVQYKPWLRYAYDLAHLDYNITGFRNRLSLV